MRLIDISRALLTEGIQIKDFKKLHAGRDFRDACENFESRIQNDADARERFGLKDLDALKGDPVEFVRRVGNALEYIEERRSQRKGRKHQSKIMRSLENLPDEVALVYRNKNYAVVAPQHYCYSALAAHLDGATAPWCIAVNDGSSIEHLEKYSAIGVFYFYDLRRDNSWAMVVDPVAYHTMLDSSRVHYREFEDRSNELSGEEANQRAAFEKMLSDIGEDDEDSLNSRLSGYIEDNMYESLDASLARQIRTELENFGDYDGLYREDRIREACEALVELAETPRDEGLMELAVQNLAENDEDPNSLYRVLGYLKDTGLEFSCVLARPLVDPKHGSLCRNLLEFLLDGGADDLEDRDEDGETLLMGAIRAGNAAVVEFILERDPDEADYVENDQAETALDIAREIGGDEVGKVFAEAGFEL